VAETVISPERMQGRKIFAFCGCTTPPSVSPWGLGKQQDIKKQTPLNANVKIHFGCQDTYTSV
jgi:hypothetical protein